MLRKSQVVILIMLPVICTIQSAVEMHLLVGLGLVQLICKGRQETPGAHTWVVHRRVVWQLHLLGQQGYNRTNQFVRCEVLPKVLAGTHIRVGEVLVQHAQVVANVVVEIDVAQCVEHPLDNVSQRVVVVALQLFLFLVHVRFQRMQELERDCLPVVRNVVRRTELLEIEQLVAKLVVFRTHSGAVFALFLVFFAFVVDAVLYAFPEMGILAKQKRTKQMRDVVQGVGSGQ